ncbi:hypothetical protein Goklo_020445 [Gossypium klotzschianum]|nr:hypothetical protein [Gossypium klotzschianum]
MTMVAFFELLLVKNRDVYAVDGDVCSLFMHKRYVVIPIANGYSVMATEIMNNEVSVEENEESEASNGIEKLEISNGTDEVSENSSSMQKDEDGVTGDYCLVNSSLDCHIICMLLLVL